MEFRNMSHLIPPDEAPTLIKQDGTHQPVRADNFDSMDHNIIRVTSIDNSSIEVFRGRVLVEFDFNLMNFVFTIDDHEGLSKVFDRLVKHIANHYSISFIREFDIKIGNITYTMDDLNSALMCRAGFANAADEAGIPQERWPGLRKTNEPLPDFFRRVW